VGAADLPKRPLVEKFLHGAIVPVNAYQSTKFQLPSSISFRDNERVTKYNVGLLAPCHTRYAETFMCAPSTWQDQTACQISACSSMHHAVTRICICFPLYVPKTNGDRKLIFGKLVGIYEY